MFIKSYEINAKGALSTLNIFKIKIDKDLITFSFKKKKYDHSSCSKVLQVYTYWHKSETQMNIINIYSEVQLAGINVNDDEHNFY